MIPLRVRVEGASGPGPYVLRLHPAVDRTLALRDDRFAFLLEVDPSGPVYETSAGGILRFSAAGDSLVGDVILVDPQRGVAHRLLRPHTDHNSLLVTEQCDQLCIMCSQPPKKQHFDLFPLYEQAVWLAPHGITIGITGGEPTLHKGQLLAFLQSALDARPDLSFHVLTNAQHFEPSDGEPLAALSSNVVWGVPLYGPSATLHDEIVGKAGAFSVLRRSLALLARLGCRLELRTVLLRTNADSMPALAEYIATHVPFVGTWAIMQLENIGFGRLHWNDIFFDNSQNFEPVGTAIDVARARDVDVALYNFPLCTVPAPYRQYAVKSISDWKRRYLDVCNTCRQRDACGGFFEWYPDRKGFQQVAAQ